MGAVLMAALAYFAKARILVGRTLGNAEPDRFREAWIRLAQSVYTGTPPT